jgi:ribosomal protein L13
MIKKLKIYTGDKHPHEAQMPKAHSLKHTGRGMV